MLSRLAADAAPDYGVGDGDGGCVSCKDTSGVAAGEALAADGDGVGELSLSDEGACINESKELLASLGEGVGLAAKFVGGGLDSSDVSSS
jgi:hypothetical protein